MADSNLNIPVLSVGELVDQMTNYYLKSMENMQIKDIVSLFLWGPFGVGKSSAIKQMAKRLEESTEKKVVVRDIRLLLYSPVDLKGVPMADEKRAFTNWLTPKVFQMDTSDDVINILFLDELSAAPAMVQAAAYQIVLDRIVGEYVLPDNCIVIGAGNRTTDRSVAYRMPSALANRFLHFTIEADYESWLEWAIKNDINERVIGYISNRPEKLFNDDVALDDVAIATPRSWTFVSNILNAMQPQDVSEIHNLISGAIGAGNAYEFEAWNDVYKELPSAEKIFQGQVKVFPKKQDVLYALVTSMIVYVKQYADEITSDELENGCHFASEFPADFTAMFYRSVITIDKLKMRLLMCQSLKDWVKDNRKYRIGV